MKCSIFFLFIYRATIARRQRTFWMNVVSEFIMDPGSSVTPKTCTEPPTTCSAKIHKMSMLLVLAMTVFIFLTFHLDWIWLFHSVTLSKFYSWPNINMIDTIIFSKFDFSRLFFSEMTQFREWVIDFCYVYSSESQLYCAKIYLCRSNTSIAL